MNRSFYNRTLLLVFSLGFVSCSLAEKPWTFLVYLAAANNLNEYAGRDLAEMMKIGSNDNVNILVYLTIQKEGEEKVTRRLFVNEGSLEQIGPDMQRDSGDPNTLMEALHWAITDYPSEHIAVVLWNHGSGALNRSKMPLSLRAICYDDDTNNVLTDNDCLSAFLWARDELRGGNNFDIIACDACLMAEIEVAYTFAPCADYFVASQELIPGDGYEYARLLKPVAERSLDPDRFACHMVDAYGDEYESYRKFTLSALDLHELDPLVEKVNAISHLLIEALQGSSDQEVRDIIYECADKQNLPAFDDGIYIDLYRFYKNLRRSASKMELEEKDYQDLRDELKQAGRLVKKCVIANTRSRRYRKARGLSIYFPNRLQGIESTYPGLYWSQNTDWFSFISVL